MSIEMNGNTKVELNAGDVKITADNIEMKNANAPAPKLTAKVVLTDSVQNQFQFITLLNNLQAYVAKAIQEMDPQVTNEAIELIASDIKATNGLVEHMNRDIVHPGAELSIAFFGKRTAPTVFLSDDFTASEDEPNVIPFGQYLELREDRFPSMASFYGNIQVPMLFNVASTGNGYHLVRFIGFEAAFERATELLQRVNNMYPGMTAHRMQQSLTGIRGQSHAVIGQTAGSMYPQRFSGEANPSSQF